MNYPATERIHEKHPYAQLFNTWGAWKKALDSGDTRLQIASPNFVRDKPKTHFLVKCAGVYKNRLGETVIVYKNHGRYNKFWPWRCDKRGSYTIRGGRYLVEKTPFDLVGVVE